MRILIADDDPMVADLLSHHCTKLDAGAAVEIASDGQQALARLNKEAFDLLVLDLEMPGMDGRELLSAIDATLPVIVATGDREFAVDAFRYNVVDYLIKPVAFDRFAQAWRKVGVRKPPVAADAARSTNVVFVREGSDIVRLDLGEVRFIKSESNYVRFHLEGRDVTSLMNMKDLEQKLPSFFVRVHRSYIVNLRHVEKLDSNDVKIGRELIPVSETYRGELTKRLDLL